MGSTGGGGLAFLFVLSAVGFAYLVLSACGLYGAIECHIEPVRVAVVGYLIVAASTIMSLIEIGVIVDKDGRYENNGKTYEIAIDITALIPCGVICK